MDISARTAASQTRNLTKLQLAGVPLSRPGAASAAAGANEERAAGELSFAEGRGGKWFVFFKFSSSEQNPNHVNPFLLQRSCNRGTNLRDPGHPTAAGATKGVHSGAQALRYLRTGQRTGGPPCSQEPRPAWGESAPAWASAAASRPLWETLLTPARRTRRVSQVPTRAGPS